MVFPPRSRQIDGEERLAPNLLYIKIKINKEHQNVVLYTEVYII